MPKTVLESDLRSILRDELRFPSGTVSFVEFGFGGDAGFPDSFIANTRLCRWEPMELKRGKNVVSKLRPSQRRWHRISIELGIKTYGMTIDLKQPLVRGYQLLVDRGELIEELQFEKNADCLNYNEIIAWLSV